MACLDDQLVLRFVSGTLDTAERSVVESELARCARCAALVAAIVRQSDAGLPPHEDRYELGAPIARGGMGTIARAFDRKLGRAVAIKRLDAKGATARARFDREIHVTAALQHPNIVPIYDAGELPDGRPFYAMRHVPGQSLDEVIAAATERLALLGPIASAAEAVAYAHGRGVVHRDLKPLNILVGPFGETVVIDWGLAKVAGDASLTVDVLAEGSAPDLGATRDGTILGTPRYMAPEQARGEAATTATDVYALGAILFHALSGELPLETKTAAAAIDALAAGKIRKLGEVAPQLPRDLVAIVERAMAIEIAERYADAGELAADLRRFQTGQMVSAYRYSRPDRVGRFARRHKIALAVAGIAAVVTAVIAAGSFVRVVRERDAASAAGERAERERARAEHERTGAEGLVQFMLSDLRKSLASIGRFDVLTGVADRVGAYLDADGAHDPAAQRARARVIEIRASVADGTGDPALANRLDASALALLDDSIAAQPIRAALATQAAVRAMAAGDSAAALAHHREAAAIWRALGDQPASLAASLADIGEVSDRRGQVADAEAAWHEATATIERARAAQPGNVELASRQALVRISMGQAKARHGDAAGAERDFAAAVAAVPTPATNEARRVSVMALNQLADARSSLGRASEAHPLHLRARELVEAALAVEPSSTRWQQELARSLRELARDAEVAHDPDSAALLLEQSSAAFERLVAANPADVRALRAAAMTASDLGEALAHRDEAKARAAIAHSVDDFGALAKPGDVGSELELAFELRQSAAFERRAGHRAAAIAAITRALAIATANPGTLPVHAYYRAAVLAEAATIEGRKAYRAQAQRIVAELDHKGQLQPDWRADLGGHK